MYTTKIKFQRCCFLAQTRIVPNMSTPKNTSEDAEIEEEETAYSRDPQKKYTKDDVDAAVLLALYFARFFVKHLSVIMGSVLLFVSVWLGMVWALWNCNLSEKGEMFLQTAIFAFSSGCGMAVWLSTAYSVDCQILAQTVDCISTPNLSRLFRDGLTRISEFVNFLLFYLPIVLILGFATAPFRQNYCGASTNAS